MLTAVASFALGSGAASTVLAALAVSAGWGTLDGAATGSATEGIGCIALCTGLNATVFVVSGLF